jgi:hypothetical protein
VNRAGPADGAAERLWHRARYEPSMTTKALAAALVLAFPSVIPASCLRAPEADDTAPPAATSTASASIEGASEPAEPIGEAQQKATKAECYAAWKWNLTQCETSPPNLQPACWFACSALLAACLATAQ